MKIWVIGRGYPTPKNRMLGSFELDQAKLLARSGHDVSYISLTLKFRIQNDTRKIRQFVDEQVNIYTYSHFHFPRMLGINCKSIENKCWNMLFDIAKDKTGQPDIIHIHYPSMISSTDVIDKYRMKGVKIFVTEHWTKVQKMELTNFELERLQYYTTYANCFITVGKSLQNSIRKLVNVSVPMEIIPNLYSPIFKPINRKKTGKHFTFVVSGRMVSVKRFNVVIEAFCKLFDEEEDIWLKLIGDGPERHKLEIIGRNNKHIIFTGSLDSNSVAKELASCDALICISSLETFAVPIIEAWACGIPVITLKSIPASDYCNEKLGIVLQNGSTSELESAMKNIINNYVFDKKYISEFAKNYFSDIPIINSLEKIYSTY